jgi:hypothetical protein
VLLPRLLCSHSSADAEAFGARRLLRAEHRMHPLFLFQTFLVFRIVFVQGVAAAQMFLLFRNAIGAEPKTGLDIRRHSLSSVIREVMALV